MKRHGRNYHGDQIIHEWQHDQNLKSYVWRQWFPWDESYVGVIRKRIITQFRFVLLVGEKKGWITECNKSGPDDHFTCEIPRNWILDVA